MMNIISWNCQGWKSNGRWLLNVINNFDILIIQETWLHSFEQDELKIFDNYSFFHKSAMPDHKSKGGRPYGGVAMLYRKDIPLKPWCDIISDDSRIGATVMTDIGCLLIVNVYFPVNNHVNEELCSKYIAKLDLICKSHDGPVIIGGDMNISPGKNKFTELNNMCNDNELILADVSQLPSTTITFCSKGLGHTSWPDHFIVSEGVSVNCEVIIDANPSDHLSMNIEVSCTYSSQELQNDANDNISKDNFLNWKKVSNRVKSMYNEKVFSVLSNQFSDINLCYAESCTDEKHNNELSECFDRIVSALSNCEKYVKENFMKISKKHSYKFIPGWNSTVKQYYENYRMLFLKWMEEGRQCEETHSAMKKARLLFRRQLSRCRRNRDACLRDNLALEYNGRNFAKFWGTIKSFEKGPSTITTKLEGKTDPNSIAEQWASNYSELFNSNDGIQNRNYVHDFLNNNRSACFSGWNNELVSSAIHNLKAGKARGSEGLCAENLLYGGPIVSNLLCLFFNSAMVHGFLPQKLMNVQIVPILKKPQLDKEKVGNYRPIAIASVISKVMDKLVLSLNEKLFVTTANQFGYKKKVGTETAIFTLKHVAHNFLSNDTPVYIAYLDATKAFDLVHHWTRLRKLIDSGLDYLTIRILCYWFRNQFFVVRWGNILSSPFPVRNSCRQGGLLSPYLFAIYVDRLSEKLSESGLGCHVGNIITNHLSFADDFCLLATSIHALKRLLSLCEEYASEHRIIFNPSKTVCQCFVPRSFDVTRPRIVFCGKVIKWSDSVPYLGYDISCWDRDINELVRRRRDIYVRSNIISSRFRICSFEVKKYLFSTYFNSIYCMSLWCPVKPALLHKVKVAYNDAFRNLFNLNRRCSISSMFVKFGIDSFDVCRRKAAFSLLQRVGASSNVLLQAVYNSRAFTCSSIVREWKSLLLGNHEGDINIFYQV